MNKTILLLTLLYCSIFSWAQKPRLVIPTGHTNPIISLSLDYKEKILASADQSAQVVLWDLETHKELYALAGHAEGINSVAFSPVAPFLATGSNDKTVIVWNLQRGGVKQSTLEGHTDAVTRVLYTKDGAFIISASYDGNILVWEAATGKQVRTLVAAAPIHSLSLSATEEFLVCGTRPGDVITFNFQSGQKLKSVAIGATVNDVQFSDDQKTLIVGDNTGKISIINFANGSVGKTLKAFDFRCYRLLSTPKPDIFLATGRDPGKNVVHFNIRTGEEVDDKSLVEPVGPGFETGINTALYNKDRSKLFIPNYNSCLREWDVKASRSVATLCGSAKAIMACSIDATGRYLSVASNRSEVLIMDLTGASDTRLVSGHKAAVRAIAFHPTQKRFVTASDDGKLLLWDTDSWAPLASYTTDVPYAGSPIYFDATTQGFFKMTSEGSIGLFTPGKAKPEKINLKDVFDYRVSPDGNLLVSKTPNTLSFYPGPKFGKATKLTVTGVSDYDFQTSGKLLVVDGNAIKIFDAVNRKEEKSFVMKTGKGSNRIKAIPGKNLAVTWNTAATKFSASRDYSLNLWNLDNGSLVSTLEGHTGAITSVSVLKETFLFSSSMDGTVRVWNLNETQHSAYKASLIPLDGQNWAVTTATGIFDATQAAMHTMHYMQGSETISIDQLKQTYYEPSLLPKILGYNTEPIRTAKELSQMELYPEINLLHPMVNGGKLGVELNDQGGGYGRVIIMINDKEVVQDLTELVTVDKLSPQISMSYSLEGHPNIKPGDLNKVTVKAYNKLGDLVSRPKTVYLPPDENAKKTTPKLYALLAGVSDYQGTELDLKFAAKDATDIAEALRMSSNHYLGEANIEVTLLSTDITNPVLRPTKANIKRVLEKFAKSATASDILFIYLSGHGVNFGGSEGDFYYLTADAQNALLSDETVRNNCAISSKEFTDLIKKVRATKQVMILDACHSGQLAGNLAKSQSSTKVRAIEDMKDKTGLYVLAGSAADAVSYEASSYGQGVLTYSLLFGIKGPALRENEYIDIVKLFQFAVDKVPQLAAGIGGIQKPEIRIPSEASSFDVGKVTEDHKNKIVLSQPKPVFIRSEFQEEVQLFDAADLSMEVDNELKVLTGGGSGKVDFIDARKFPGSYTLRGRYLQKENEITAKVRMFKNDKPTFEFELTAPTPKELASKIVTEAFSRTKE